ncbi:MAG: glycoside hydrolase family 3 protein, partial [Chrysiogenales bacterium]
MAGVIMKSIRIACAVITACVISGCAQKRYDGEALLISRMMDLDRKIGQMIMVAIPGSEMSRDTERILERYKPGGVILFGYNLSSFESNRRFIASMQESSMRHSGVPLFVSIDQEGGRVVRIVSGITQFPGTMAAGVAGNARLAYHWGRALGLQLRDTGVNMNLAPVLDVNNNPRNPVINTRSFGPDPRLVAKLGAAYIKGLQESRCIAVGKH